MMSNQRDIPPKPTEFEISIFGPGYGESIVLHIGNGQWILVDSCLEPESREPAPTQYLNDIGVDIASDVKLIIATHWHDDHVRGIGRVFSKCKSADIAIPSIFNTSEVLKLFHLYSTRFMVDSSGIDEFTRVFEILEDRKQENTRFNTPKLAIADRQIYSASINSHDVKVFSLSPSDASIMQAQLAFSKLFPSEQEDRTRIAELTPNHASVVLWIEVGKHNILLGADLENTKDSKTGWSAILDESTSVSGKAGVFKVSHHGAESAHEPRIWSEVLLSEPIALLTPFIRGNRELPTTEDTTRILNLTPNAYITAPATQRRYKSKSKIVRETVSQVTKDIRPINVGWGQIRLRNEISLNDSSWQIELFGNAVPLSKLVTSA